MVVVEFSKHVSIMNVHAFLRLISYYHNYIKGYAKIVVPLFELIKKHIDFRWVPIYQGAFETLKRTLMEAPILYQQGFYIGHGLIN